jgi:single-strand DNA-binding protein
MLQIIAAGRLGKDSELRSTQSGTKVLNFSVGTDVRFGQNKKTVWIDCSIFGDRAEKLEQYLTRGMPVTVIGEGNLRTWDANGKAGSAITCNVREISLQGTKRDDASHAPATGGGWDAPPDDMDDAIPFATNACDEYTLYRKPMVV